MKKFLISVMLLLFVISCKTENKIYPDIKPDQIGTKLLWDMNYADVKKILTEDFKLEFSQEMKQSDKYKIGKAYEFTGGKFNGFETVSWIPIIEYNGLIALTINLKDLDPERISELEKQLRNSLKPDTTYPSSDNRLILEKEGKRISEVQILTKPEDNFVCVTYFKSFIKQSTVTQN